MIDHHHHHHDHDDASDASLPIADQSLDPANKSLSDALLLSFRLLKAVMLLLVIAYLLSGTFMVDANEEAVVMTLGRISDTPRQPGLHYSFPFPFSERWIVRVKEKKVLDLRNFWFKVSDQDRGKTVAEMSARQAGLEPGVDGALLTGDRNIVHLELQVQYYIDDSVKYVRRLAEGPATIDAAIAGAIDSSIIRVVAAVDVDEILRGQVESLMVAAKARAQKILDELDCGIRLDAIIVLKKTWPLQTAPAFVNVQRAENEKLQMVEEARGEARTLLNQSAGPRNPVIAAKIRAYEAARNSGDSAAADALDAEIVGLLETIASGESATIISEANSYKAETIQQVQASAQLFQELLPRYRENPELLKTRLWLDVMSKLVNSLGVEKYQLPDADGELRIIVKPSKEQAREYEEEQAKQRQAQQKRRSN